MLASIFKSGLAVGILAVALVAGAPGARADSLSFGFSFGSPGYGDQNHRYRYRDAPRYRDGGRHYHERGARGCSVRRAVRKAHRFGLRNTQVIRATRRDVVLSGYKRGRPVTVRMGRERGCPVIAYRRR